MNDTERDARIAECMGYLNAHFQRLLSFRIGNATLIKGAEADLWAWATNLRDAIQPPTGTITAKCTRAGCEYDAWSSLCHKHYVEALEDYKREHPRSLAQSGRPIDDSIPDRVYTEPLQSWMEAVRRQVKANAQSAQDSKNLAEQACARMEAAVYCLAEYSDSAGQPQRCRMDKGHVGGHTQNPATTKHRR